MKAFNCIFVTTSRTVAASAQKRFQDLSIPTSTIIPSPTQFEMVVSVPEGRGDNFRSVVASLAYWGGHIGLIFDDTIKLAS